MAALDFMVIMREERAKARAARDCVAASPAKALAGPSTRAPAEAGEPEASESRFRLAAGPPREVLGESSVVHGAPPTVWHMRDWVSADEEAAMLRAADDAPASQWTSLRGRRLQNMGGVPRPAPDVMVQEPIPGWVRSVFDALVAAGVFDAAAPPNHALLNEYQPGQGIGPHRDGPLYEPTVAIISLGSPCSFEFLANDTQRAPLASLLLPARGLLVFRHAAYHEHLHTVPAVETDAGRAGLIRLDLDSGVLHCRL